MFDFPDVLNRELVEHWLVLPWGMFTPDCVLTVLLSFWVSCTGQTGRQTDGQMDKTHNAACACDSRV